MRASLAEIGCADICYPNHVLYSTAGCQRTWGSPSQPGIVLNFLNSSWFTFLNAIKPVCVKAVQHVTSVPTFQVHSILNSSLACS